MWVRACVWARPVSLGRMRVCGGVRDRLALRASMRVDTDVRRRRERLSRMKKGGNDDVWGVVLTLIEVACKAMAGCRRSPSMAAPQRVRMAQRGADPGEAVRAWSK